MQNAQRGVIWSHKFQYSLRTLWYNVNTTWIRKCGLVKFLAVQTQQHSNMTMIQLFWFLARCWNDLNHMQICMHSHDCLTMQVGMGSPASLRTEPLSRIFWGFRSRWEMFRSLRNWRAQAVCADTHTHKYTVRETQIPNSARIVQSWGLHWAKPCIR